MGHARQVGDVGAPGQVLAQGEGQRGLRRPEGGRLEDVAQIDDLRLGIGDLHADRALAGDRGDDADAPRLHRQRQVGLQVGDAVHLDPRRGHHLELGHDRPGGAAADPALHAERAELLHQHLAQLRELQLHAEGILRLRSVQQIDRRQRPFGRLLQRLLARNLCGQGTLRPSLGRPGGRLRGRFRGRLACRVGRRGRIPQLLHNPVQHFRDILGNAPLRPPPGRLPAVVPVLARPRPRQASQPSAQIDRGPRRPERASQPAERIPVEGGHQQPDQEAREQQRRPQPADDRAEPPGQGRPQPSRTAGAPHQRGHAGRDHGEAGGQDRRTHTGAGGRPRARAQPPQRQQDRERERRRAQRPGCRFAEPRTQQTDRVPRRKPRLGARAQDRYREERQKQEQRQNHQGQSQDVGLLTPGQKSALFPLPRAPAARRRLPACSSRFPARRHRLRRLAHQAVHQAGVDRSLHKAPVPQNA